MFGDIFSMQVKLVQFYSATIQMEGKKAESVTNVATVSFSFPKQVTVVQCLSDGELVHSDTNSYKSYFHIPMRNSDSLWNLLHEYRTKDILDIEMACRLRVGPSESLRFLFFEDFLQVSRSTCCWFRDWITEAEEKKRKRQTIWCGQSAAARLHSQTWWSLRGSPVWNAFSVIPSCHKSRILHNEEYLWEEKDRGVFLYFPFFFLFWTENTPKCRANPRLHVYGWMPPSPKTAPHKLKAVPFDSKTRKHSFQFLLACTLWNEKRTESLFHSAGT